MTINRFESQEIPFYGSSEEVSNKLYELSTMFEVSKALIEATDSESLKHQLVLSSLGATGAKSGVFFDYHPDVGLSVVVGYGVKISSSELFHFEKKWLDFLIQEREGIPLELNRKEKNLESFVLENRVWVVQADIGLLVPLTAGKELVGILGLGRKVLDKDYSVQDLNLVSTIAHLAAIALKNLERSGLPEKKEKLFFEKIETLTDKEVKKDLELLRQEYPVLKEIIGESKVILELFQNILQVAFTKCPVLLLGESGSGKELVAKAVHQLSSRKDFHFVELNCASLPPDLVESELFGHVKGAFTGAINEKNGVFQLAHNGTLFLDEIGDMNFSAQSKLLRVLQEGRFKKVGGEKIIEVDVRMITATNKDIINEVKNGNFREDLFYRINVFPIRILPLRERKSDICLLVNYFLKRCQEEFGVTDKKFSFEALQLLENYSYPGNVRELKNLVERSCLKTKNSFVIEASCVQEELEIEKQEYKQSEKMRVETKKVPDSDEELTQREEVGDLKLKRFFQENKISLEEMERFYIKQILELSNNNKSKAAQMMGIPRSTLMGKMKKLKLI